MVHLSWFISVQREIIKQNFELISWESDQIMLEIERNGFVQKLPPKTSAETPDNDEKDRKEDGTKKSIQPKNE